MATPPTAHASAPVTASPSSTSRTIDLNADLGESYGAWTMGDDDAMLGLVTSANVACGFHGGDPAIMRRTVAAAAARGVTIGAHVAYPDRVGFGRRAMDVEPSDLEADVLFQLGALDAMCRAEGTTVRHVKAHGALYHRTNGDTGQAHALVAALVAFDPSLLLLCNSRSVIGDVARQAGVVAVGECFADRAYQSDGELVPRGHPGAVLHDPDVVAAQALSLAVTGRYQSMCVHGDSPGAVEAARSIRRVLERAGFDLRSFAPAPPAA